MEQVTVGAVSRTSADVCSSYDFTVYFSEVHFVCVQIGNKTKRVSKCLPDDEFPEWTTTDGEQRSRGGRDMFRSSVEGSTCDSIA